MVGGQTSSSDPIELQDRVKEGGSDFEIKENYKMSEMPELNEPPSFSCSQLRQKMWYRNLMNRVRWMISVRYHSYYWRHLFFWVLIGLVMSGPMYAAGRPADMPYIDALFYVFSAITATGLATRDLSKEPIAFQILMTFCMIISGAVFESLLPLFVRLWATRSRRSDRKDRGNDDELQSEIQKEFALLSPEERREERRLTIILLVIVSLYYFLNIAIVFLITGFYFQFSSAGSAVMDKNNLNAWWFSIFQAFSSFNDCGFGLLFDSLVQVSNQILPLIVYGALILLGNTAYPIFFRAAIFLCELVLRLKGSPLSASFQKILKNPRSYSTFLFPAGRTWILLALLVIFIGFQTIMMVALPNGEAFPAGLNDGYIFANALFQSISVRTAGLNTIYIGNLSMEALIIMVVMMYIAAYPNIVTIRSTNEEQSKKKQSSVHQLRRLLMQDAMWVIFPWFLICAFEDYNSYANGFKVLFEVVSAYGTVGLSLGLYNFPYSFCGVFGIGSKLVIILTMLMGRHRGMPDQFDAVFLKTFTRPFEVKSREKDIL